MLTTMRLMFMSQDVKEAMDQTVDAFGASLARVGEQPRFEKISELAFCFGVAHPVMPPQGKGRASYSRDSGVFLTEAYLDYGAWIGDRWADRVRAVARASQTALSSVHKTRLAAEERSRLSQLIEIVAERLATSPPDHLPPLKSIYACEDEFGRKLSIGFQPPGAFVLGLENHRIVELQPEEVLAYVGRQQEAVQTVQTVKLYKRHNGQLLYREAWIDGENVVEHAGVYGERGLTSQHAASGPVRQREVMDTITANAEADGFKAIPEARMIGLLVSKEISGAGTKGGGVHSGRRGMARRGHHSPQGLCGHLRPARIGQELPGHPPRRLRGGGCRELPARGLISGHDLTGDSLDVQLIRPTHSS